MPESRRRLLRFTLFVLPVLLWMGVILIGSSTLLVYTNSWLLIQNAIQLFAPEFTLGPHEPSGIVLTISMYMVNSAARRVAHIVIYAVLACLLVRAIQGGEPRLKRASLIGTIVLSILYVGIDELYRHFTPQRDAKWFDLTLNLIGVVIVLTGTVLWFALKELERRSLAPPLPPEEPTGP